MRKLLTGGLVAGVMVALTGCGNFFQHPGSTTTTTSSTGADYVYAVGYNGTTAVSTLTGYVVGSGGLTAITGTPLTLEAGLAPRSVAVSRGNSFVYVGGNGAIDCYQIGTAGVLTALSTARVTATANFVSLDTSYDGKWLFGLDSTTQSIYVYSLNTTTGLPSLLAGVPYASPSTGTQVVPTMVRISPSSNVVVATLGTAGDAFFTFNDSTGALLQVGTSVYAAGYSDNAVFIDQNSAFVYIARTILTAGTSGVASYAITSAGVPTTAAGLVASGAAPGSLTIDLTGAYLYAGNRTDGTVTGYSLASGVPTTLTTAPYASSPATVALVRDNSGKYVVAIGNTGVNDVTLLALDALTAGKLDAVAVASTGSAGQTAVAATHTTAGL